MQVFGHNNEALDLWLASKSMSTVQPLVRWVTAMLKEQAKDRISSSALLSDIQNRIPSEEYCGACCSGVVMPEHPQSSAVPIGKACSELDLEPQKALSDLELQNPHTSPISAVAARDSAYTTGAFPSDDADIPQADTSHDPESDQKLERTSSSVDTTRSPPFTPPMLTAESTRSPPMSPPMLSDGRQTSSGGFFSKMFRSKSSNNFRKDRATSTGSQGPLEADSSNQPEITRHVEGTAHSRSASRDIFSKDALTPTTSPDPASAGDRDRPSPEIAQTSTAENSRTGSSFFSKWKTSRDIYTVSKQKKALENLSTMFPIEQEERSRQLAFSYCLSKSDYSAANALLDMEKGFDLNGNDRNGQPLLFSVLQTRDERFIENFINHGADPNIKDSEGVPALHFLLGQKPFQGSRITDLIGLGADVNVRSATEKHAFHVCAALQRTSVMDILVANGALVDINSLDKDQESPTTVAAACGYHFVALKLIQLGAEVNVQSLPDPTKQPLYQAVFASAQKLKMEPHLDFVGLFLEAGAQVTAGLLYSVLGAVDMHELQREKLFVLLLQGYEETQGLPITQHFDFGDSRPWSDTSELPLRERRRWGLQKACIYLLQSGHTLPPGQVGLMSGQAWPHATKLALERGASATERDSTGCSPVERLVKMSDYDASQSDWIATAKVLLDHGIEDREKQIMLWELARVKRFRGKSRSLPEPKAMIERLIGEGVDVNMKFGPLDTTPLMEVCARAPDEGRIQTLICDMAECFVQHGADLEALNNQGQTAYQMASVRYKEDSRPVRIQREAISIALSDVFFRNARHDSRTGVEKGPFEPNAS